MHSLHIYWTKFYINKNSDKDCLSSNFNLISSMILYFYIKRMICTNLCGWGDTNKWGETRVVHGSDGPAGRVGSGRVGSGHDLAGFGGSGQHLFFLFFTDNSGGNPVKEPSTYKILITVLWRSYGGFVIPWPITLIDIIRKGAKKVLNIKRQRCVSSQGREYNNVSTQFSR